MLTRGKSRDAFTLVELLCSLLLCTVIAGAAIGVLSGCIQSYERVLALAEARRRGQSVLQILRLPVENASLGLPSKAEEFKASLSVGKAALAAVKGWDGPVSVAAGELRLLYAVPTTIVNEGLAAETSSSQDRAVKLSAPVTDGQVQAWTGFGPTVTKSWVLFPPSGVPFLVKGLSNRTLSVRSSISSCIFHNARLHYLRGIRARVVLVSGQEPAFCTEDVTSGSGLQERVLGISGFLPAFDPVNRTLTLTVLSRGGRRHPEAVSPARLPGWPEPIEDEDRRYVLSVTSRTWRIRNGTEP